MCTCIPLIFSTQTIHFESLFLKNVRIVIEKSIYSNDMGDQKRNGYVNVTYLEMILQSFTMALIRKLLQKVPKSHCRTTKE